ncbi:hypothetical protein BT96DRAFT_981824 [Gymnopus androsaceus JB14]|uniref:Transposase Tc1-like domain-containing protein n=1 Tax=Gymnopus androsaceus JB14 TaxID=1447944 RepID=A0A6A4GLH2_9AGAR|nr:hypothetical protein BT96DRAFT_981824 [Gymnopus androsaceus JB14]
MAQGKATSDDMCWTVVRLSGLHTPSEIRAITGVSMRNQQAIMRRFHCLGDPTVIPLQQQGRPRHLRADEVAFIQGTVNKECDKYLDELKDDLEAIYGKTVSLVTSWRTLRRGGFRMKKLTRKAIERSTLKRTKYTARIGSRYTSNQLVFVDKSSADQCTMYRNYAWALSGKRATRKAFFIRGQRIKLMFAL